MTLDSVEEVFPFMMHAENLTFELTLLQLKHCYYGNRAITFHLDDRDKETWVLLDRFTA